MSEKTALKTEEKTEEEKEGPPVAVMTKENTAVETAKPKTPEKESVPRTPAPEAEKKEIISVTRPPETESDNELRQMLYSEFLPGRESSTEEAEEQATAPDTVIRISDLRKDYRVGWLQHRKFRALDGISFEIKAGDIFGFLGPNGAGKTTTIKILLGITRPASGSVEIFGQKGVSKAARAHIGYFPEISYYYKYLSAREAVTYYGRLYGLSRSILRQTVDWVLDVVGLFEHRNKLLRTFSKGMLQRVGLAQALINDPALLIMDEPTSGLDPLMKKEMRDMILNLNDQGKTIFFSSHELSEVEMICHKVAILDKGKIIAQGAMSEIIPAEPGLTVIVKSIPEQVEKILREHGASVSHESGNSLVSCSNDSKVHDVLAVLGANACELIDVLPRKQTLEDFFVKKIREKEMEAER